MEFKKRLSNILVFPVTDENDNFELEIKFYIEKYNAKMFLLSTLDLSTVRDIKNLISRIKKFDKEDEFIFALHAGGGSQLPVQKNMTMFPSNMTVGLSDNPKNAYKIANMLAKELNSLGINLVISDFCNINMHDHNIFVGTNSFRDNSESNHDYIKNYIKGFKDAGVFLAATGFPGTGALEEFSDEFFNTSHRTLEQMYKEEIQFFKKAIDNGLNILEINDIYYFKESKTVKEPACFSYDIIDFLRNTLEFKGIIMSSPLYRKAFDEADSGDNVLRALKAGCNLIIMPTGLKNNINAYNRLYMELKKGEIHKDLEGHMNCDTRLKENKKNDNNKTIYYLKKEHKEKISKIYSKSIKIFHGKSVIDTISEKKEILVIAPHMKSFTGEDSDNYFYKSVRFFKRKSEFLEYGITPNNNKIETIKKELGKYEGIIYFSYNSHLDQGRENLSVAINKNHSYVINIGIDSPHEYKLFKDSSSYISIASYFEDAIQSVCEKILKNN